MKHRVRHPRSVLAILFLSLTACHASGTWVDDARNWERAFGSSVPEGVTVAHSWYWRSSHWTREEAYYFELDGAEIAFEALRSANGMRLVAVAEQDALLGTRCFEAPAWFPAADDPSLEAWISESGASALYRNPLSETVYYSACQL